MGTYRLIPEAQRPREHREWKTLGGRHRTRTSAPRSRCCARRASGNSPSRPFTHELPSLRSRRGRQRAPPCRSKYISSPKHCPHPGLVNTSIMRSPADRAGDVPSLGAASCRLIFHAQAIPDLPVPHPPINTNVPIGMSHQPYRSKTLVLVG